MAAGRGEVAGAGMPQLAPCPTCRGRLMLDDDPAGFDRLRCWNCGRYWPVKWEPRVIDVEEEYFLMGKEGRHRR